MSSDTSWLPLSDRKNIPQVKVVYEEYCGQNYSGYYYFNTIVIALHPGECHNFVASTIAHEFRHHIQRVLNQHSVPAIPVPEDIETNYNKAIRRYFRYNISEMDALVYQNKIIKAHTPEYWLKACVLSNTM